LYIITWISLKNNFEYKKLKFDKTFRVVSSQTNK
jgi:hypothetical protein